MWWTIFVIIVFVLAISAVIKNVLTILELLNKQEEKYEAKQNTRKRL